MKNPKCPFHNKELDIIYPGKELRLCRFDCGCILFKNKMFQTNEGNIIDYEYIVNYQKNE